MDKINENALFDIPKDKQYEFNLGIAVELIKKVLYKENKINSQELKNVIDIACGSVRNKSKLI